MKRQKRFFREDIRKIVGTLNGQKVNLILEDKQVLYLEILQVEKDSLLGRDMILKKHRIELNKIEEIIQDY
jgi:hypothetical protein